MGKVFKHLIPILLLAAMPLMVTAANHDAVDRNDSATLSTDPQARDTGLKLTPTGTMNVLFPTETCWGDLFDITISGVTGNLLEDCHGDSLIAISLAIWEDDGWTIWEAGGDDRVVEEYFPFETGGLISGVPFSHTYENIDLSGWIDGINYAAEFYVEIKGPCLPGLTSIPSESHDVVDIIFRPTAPDVVAPGGGAVVSIDPVTLQWNSRHNADYYEVQLNDVNTFDTPLVFEQTTNLTYDVAGLDDSTTYYWRVRAHNNTCGDGNWCTIMEFSTDMQLDVAEIPSPGLPQTFTLSQNYPNPFNPDTDIEFALPRACHVTLGIYNITGQEVRRLIDEELSAGYKTVRWDGTNNEGSAVASGVYLYRLIAGDNQASRKMLLLK